MDAISSLEWALRWPFFLEEATLPVEDAPVEGSESIEVSSLKSILEVLSLLGNRPASSMTSSLRHLDLMHLVRKRTHSVLSTCLVSSSTHRRNTGHALYQESAPPAELALNASTSAVQMSGASLRAFVLGRKSEAMVAFSSPGMCRMWKSRSKIKSDTVSRQEPRVCPSSPPAVGVCSLSPPALTLKGSRTTECRSFHSTHISFSPTPSSNRLYTS
mmetsp:Transcript_6431/g.22140  ORF Transcript_6431/g.22140 Transcript_6431/m.22140 type:complete len:216 (+) Transcript_6431:2238-2885(+)